MTLVLVTQTSKTTLFLILATAVLEREKIKKNQKVFNYKEVINLIKFNSLIVNSIYGLYSAHILMPFKHIFTFYIML